MAEFPIKDNLRLPVADKAFRQLLLVSAYEMKVYDANISPDQRELRRDENGVPVWRCQALAVPFDGPGQLVPLKVPCKENLQALIGQELPQKGLRANIGTVDGDPYFSMSIDEFKPVKG